MTIHCFDCNCGNEVEFERDTVPGLTLWAQCPHCGHVWQVLPPDDEVYTGRRTRKDTQRKQDAIFDIFWEMKPQMTVRQVYYALAVRGIVPKTQSGYRQAQYQLKILRRKGILPYGWIADNTRWQIRPTVYSGLESAMRIWHDAYRRDLWESQDDHVEIWVVKDALAGVIAPITRHYTVPLYVARGFSSMTFAYDAAEEIKEIGKPVYIYHFGDFDPSGVSAAKSLREELALHGISAHFEQVAVTTEQIAIHDLPTLPVNRRDSRAKKWPYPYVCELDALPANVLRDLVRGCIERHIDSFQWSAAEQAEELERETLNNMRRYFVQVQN